MPYIHRNAQSEITGLSRWPNGSTEQLPDDAPEVIAYRNPPPPTKDQIYDRAMQNNRPLKAYIMCVDDGSIVPATNMGGPALKAAMKVKM